MERRLAVHAGPRRLQVAIALIAVAAVDARPSDAAPKGAAAKTAFDRGLAAYKKKSWAVAAEALQSSFELEPDPETLFAWAQAERQQEHCPKAIELFEKLLGFDLPAANKQAVSTKLDECRAILAAAPPAAEPSPAPVSEPVATVPAAAVVDPPTRNPYLGEDPDAPWWRQRGGWFVAGGIVGLGAGGYLLLRARELDDDARIATNYFETEDLNNRAKRFGTIGVASAVLGAGLLATGVVYLVRGDHARTRITAFVGDGSGGVVAAGRF